MTCCGDDDAKKEGMVQDRKCRDVLCLLFFIAFWAGMFVICGFAVSNGNINRIVYGTDSYGFTCGSKTTFQNATLDLSDRKNLYYLNPLDLLSVYNIPFAKTICTNGCPPPADVCNFTGLPCTTGNTFQCPYYAFAPASIAGLLTGVGPADTQWFDALGSMGSTTDPNATSAVSKLQSLNIPWINNFLSQYGISASNTVTGRYYQLTSQIPGQGPCYPIWTSGTEFFHRCFPDIPASWGTAVVSAVAGSVSAVGQEAASLLKDRYNSPDAQWTRYVSSISKGILIIIVGGLAGGVVLSLFWMIVLRYAAGLMVWITIFAVNFALVGITLYSFSFAGLLASTGVGAAIADALPPLIDPTTVDRETWKWIAIAAAIVAGIVFILTLLSISRLRIAVACIKVASQAVASMPSILLFPLIPFVFEVGLIVYWISVTGLLYSAGDLTANCRDANASTPITFSTLSNFTSGNMNVPASTSASTVCYTNMTQDAMVSSCASDPQCYVTYDWNNKMKYAFIYHFFGLLWTNQFLVGVTCVTIAGAVATYYWSRGDGSQMPRFPVLTAFKNTIVYHLGSVAFGAIIIAIIQFIRFLLEYIDRKTRQLQEGNALAQWLMCCVKCCMWCLEQIMSFINRNAYILVGVKGTGYCQSASRAVVLIVSNAWRLSVVNVVGDIMLFLGKIAVAACSGLIAFAMSTLPYYTDLSAHPDTYIGSPILPVALSILTGYAVAEIFFAVYEMAIDTVMLSFCEDCESNDGNPKFAPPLLMEVLGSGSRPPEGHDSNGKPIAR